MSGKKNENNLMRRVISVLIIGLVLVFSFSIFQTYQSEKKTAEQKAESTIQFMKTNCQKYDDYEIGLITADLQSMINKINVLRNYMQVQVQSYWQMMGGSLSEFAKNQYLSGIILLNEQLEIVENIDVENKENKELLRELRLSSQLEQILDYPQKIYADCLETEGRNYQYAVASRTDEPGIIICYLDVSKYNEDKYEISLSNLLDMGSNEEKAVVVVADGETILYSNRQNLQDLEVDEWPVLDVISRDMLPENENLIELRYNGKTWWGMNAQYRDYYLYVFYKAELFGYDLARNLSTALGVYLVVAFGVLMFVQKREKERLHQVEKEHHMLASIASIYDVNLLLDLEGNTWETILQTTAMEEALTGISKTDEMLRIFCDKLMMESAREKFLEFTDPHTLSERLKERDFLGYSFEAVRQKWYQVLLIPKVRNAENEVTKVIFLIRNVTEQTKKEMAYQEQLRISMEEAEAANAAKTDFLRKMSHDIRTPINGIRGMAEIGKNSSKDLEQTKSYFKKILSASDFLLELVNDVLDMSKIELGEWKDEQISFDLRDMMQGAITVISTQAENSGILVHCEALEGEHWLLKGNPLNVQRIYQNIMSNAIKYNRPGGSVRISCRETECDETWAMFEFVCEDTGIGMSEEFQKHAFEMFSQEHKTARTTYNGSGLGLAIVKKTVEFLNGTLDLVSKEGVGTTFTVRIPLKIDTEKYEIEEKIETCSIKGLNILLAEDNELNMEIASFVLDEQGAVVTEAKDGKQALDLFAASAPGTYDIILMDIMMPVMDGLEAARAIRLLERSDAKEIPIIAVSANAFADDIEESVRSGMNDHLSKPLDFENLFKMIYKYTKKN